MVLSFVQHSQLKKRRIFIREIRNNWSCRRLEFNKYTSQCLWFMTMLCAREWILEACSSGGALDSHSLGQIYNTSQAHFLNHEAWVTYQWGWCEPVFAGVSASYTGCWAGEDPLSSFLDRRNLMCWIHPWVSCQTLQVQLLIYHKRSQTDSGLSLLNRSYNSNIKSFFWWEESRVNWKQSGFGPQNFEEEEIRYWLGKMFETIFPKISHRLQILPFMNKVSLIIISLKKSINI